LPGGVNAIFCPKAASSAGNSGGESRLARAFNAAPARRGVGGRNGIADRLNLDQRSILL